MQKAIESCLSQTYTNLEIILINDGSTDHTQKIAQRYADCDKRIVLFNQENGGQSAARNAGLRVAKGEYIQFLDADDALEENCLYTAVNTLEKHPEASFLVFGFNIYSGNKLLRKPNPGTGIYRSGDKYQNFKSVQTVLDSPCNKLYKKSYITKLFDTHRVFAEDAIFNYENLSKDDTIVFIENSLYNVQINTQGSVNKRYQKGKLFDYLYTCELVEKKLVSMFPQEFDLTDYKTKKLAQIGHIIGTMAGNTSKTEFKEELKLLWELPYFKDLVGYKKYIKFYYRILYGLIYKKLYSMAKWYGIFITFLYQIFKG